MSCHKISLSINHGEGISDISLIKMGKKIYALEHLQSKRYSSMELNDSLGI